LDFNILKKKKFFSLQVSPKSPSASNQDDTYEVILLESTSEAERRAKLRQSAAGKYL